MQVKCFCCCLCWCLNATTLYTRALAVCARVEAMCHWIIKDEGTSIHSMLSPHIKWLWNHLTNHLSLLQYDKHVHVRFKDGEVCNILRYDMTLKYTHDA